MICPYLERVQLAPDVTLDPKSILLDMYTISAYQLHVTNTNKYISAY